MDCRSHLGRLTKWRFFLIARQANYLFPKLLANPMNIARQIIEDIDSHTSIRPYQPKNPLESIHVLANPIWRPGIALRLEKHIWKWHIVFFVSFIIYRSMGSIKEQVKSLQSGTKLLLRYATNPIWGSWNQKQNCLLLKKIPLKPIRLPRMRKGGS